MTTTPAPGPAPRTVNVSLGNVAELNMLAINPAHITHVRLTGAQHGQNRKIEVSLVSGEVVGMNFDDAERAQAVFTDLLRAMHRTIEIYPDL